MIEPTIHPTKPKSKTIDLVVSPYKRKSSLYKKDTWTVTDSYIPYKKEFGADALERKLYIKIMKEIFWEISKDLIQSILEITLPFRLGRLGIKKRKNNRTLTQQPIDYGKYNKTKTKVYHTNLHSNRCYFFWDWETRGGAANFTNQTLYKFTATRGNDGIVGKRGLASWIKHCSETPTIKDYDRLTRR